MPLISFTRVRNGRSFSDALNFTDEEFAAITEEEITTLQDARFEAWWAFINTPAEELIDG